MKAKVTLQLDEALLREVKQVTAEERRSVSAIVLGSI